PGVGKAKGADPIQGANVMLCLLAAGCTAAAQERASGPSASGNRQKLAYRIVDTGQDRCYGNSGEIAFPARGRPFHGQDAQYAGAAMSYRDNGDGTVTDRHTGLVWQKTPDFRMRLWEEAAAYAKGLALAGHDDWRLPTIKELFSIVDFRGNQHTKMPYIDTKAFDFRYPDVSEGVRGMDAQYWSSNLYVGTTMRADRSAFGFNFADGRIKCYPVAGGRKRARKYVRCVRGPAYGRNDFVDNRDGTVTDRATGLTWTKADSGRTMNWAEALEYAEGLSLAGRDDWRLPDVKELQSIVDYTRAPDARAPSARGAAIDPVFRLTDPESWFWSSTTHLENRAGYYVCFGQAFSAWKWRGKEMNAHGAGAVRSDPKSGDPRRWPDGRGPQGDEVRIRNYVRCVRGGDVRMVTAPPASSRPAARKEAGPVDSRGTRFIRRLDVDGDGKVSRAEFDGPGGHFRVLDRNGDGYLSADEAPRGPPPNRGRR
ncbi:MAG: Lcl C-terminal domain-containing protein, partial [Planctomycetota bacterium]